MEAQLSTVVIHGPGSLLRSATLTHRWIRRPSNFLCSGLDYYGMPIPKSIVVNKDFHTWRLIGWLIFHHGLELGTVCGLYRQADESSTNEEICCNKLCYFLAVYDCTSRPTTIDFEIEQAIRHHEQMLSQLTNEYRHPISRLMGEDMMLLLVFSLDPFGWAHITHDNWNPTILISIHTVQHKIRRITFNMVSYVYYCNNFTSWMGHLAVLYL